MKGIIENSTVSAARFVRVSVWCFAPSCIVGITYGYAVYGAWGIMAGILLAAAVSMVAAIAVSWGLDTVGDAAGTLYGGRRSQWTRRELLEGEMRKVQHQVKQQNFDSALQGVDTILAEDPNFQEALLVKARILVEGFERIEAATRCINRILASEPETETIHQEASGLLNELKLYQSLRFK